MVPRQRTCRSCCHGFKAEVEQGVRCLCSVSGDPCMTKIVSIPQAPASEDLLSKLRGPSRTICADPAWQFQNRTGKMATEHKRLLRYSTMTCEEILEHPVGRLAAAKSHLYLWVPNALIAEGLEVMKRWGFT